MKLLWGIAAFQISLRKQKYRSPNLAEHQIKIFYMVSFNTKKVLAKKKCESGRRDPIKLSFDRKLK